MSLESNGNATGAEALKPCPFCGNTRLRKEEFFRDKGVVRCIHCGGQMHAHATLDGQFSNEAARRWNERAVPVGRGNDAGAAQVSEKLPWIVRGAEGGGEYDGPSQGFIIVNGRNLNRDPIGIGHCYKIVDTHNAETASLRLELEQAREALTKIAATVSGPNSMRARDRITIVAIAEKALAAASPRPEQAANSGIKSLNLNTLPLKQ